MNRLIYKGFIEDVRNEKCTDQEIEKLIDVFEEAVKSFAEIYAKKPWYDKASYQNLNEFERAKEYDVEQFSLTIEREESDEKGEHFTGKFERDHKNLKILAVLKN